MWDETGRMVFQHDNDEIRAKDSTLPHLGEGRAEAFVVLRDLKPDMTRRIHV